VRESEDNGVASLKFSNKNCQPRVLNLAKCLSQVIVNEILQKYTQRLTKFIEAVGPFSKLS
jgi:hypothetical protein